MGKKKKKVNKLLPDLNLRLGITIKRLRQGQRMTQEQLSEKAQVSQAFLSLMENGYRYGDNTRVNLNTLQRIAIVLGQCNLSELIKFAEDVPKPEETITEIEKFITKV